MSQTLLIVDDSRPLHTLVKTQLEPDAMKCLSAYDGEAALASAQLYRPDLILLDVEMPRLDGFEVCRQLKANPLTDDIPIIFLTADAMLIDSVKGLDCGAIDYIAKPFRPEDLRARVRAALRTTQLPGHTRMIDGLTGLWNRTYFDLQVNAQDSLSRRLKRQLSCIVAEVHPPTAPKENKMMENEVFHLAGDVLRGKCRAEDTVCRLEHGKFVMLLTGSDRRAAVRMAERLLADMERQFTTQNQTNVSCSIGVADTLMGAAQTLLQRADTAAYQAAQLGRNCVSIARDSTTIGEA
jgi:diguanylate cyclase (GGDEF)-like protein